MSTISLWTGTGAVCPLRLVFRLLPPGFSFVGRCWGFLLALFPAWLVLGFAVSPNRRIPVFPLAATPQVVPWLHAALPQRDWVSPVFHLAGPVFPFVSEPMMSLSRLGSLAGVVRLAWVSFAVCFWLLVSWSLFVSPALLLGWLVLVLAWVSVRQIASLAWGPCRWLLSFVRFLDCLDHQFGEFPDWVVSSSACFLAGGSSFLGLLFRSFVPLSGWLVVVFVLFDDK